MKKIITLSFVIIAILSAMLFMVAATENDDPVLQIEEEYENIQKMVVTEDMSVDMNEKNIASAYAKLFKELAQGTKVRESEYAELFRDITQNTVSFHDSEVYSIAESYARFYSEVADGKSDFGVEQLEVISGISGRSLLIDYSGVRGYSVRIMSEEDTEYHGGYRIPYDGSIGKYRIEMTFYDSNAAVGFTDQYPIGTVHELINGSSITGGNLRMKCVYTPGHAFVIYVGSDEPLIVEEQEFTELNLAMGSIKIDLK